MIIAAIATVIAAFAVITTIWIMDLNQKVAQLERRLDAKPAVPEIESRGSVRITKLFGSSLVDIDIPWRRAR